jgi:hypothetical protein
MKPLEHHGETAALCGTITMLYIVVCALLALAELIRKTFGG